MRINASKLARLFTCQKGSVVTVWSLILPAVIGVIGLGTEAGTWYLTKHNMQAAADAAAIAGAYETTSSLRTSSAGSAVVANGFGSGTHVTVTVHNPPTSGGYTANNNAVEVILAQPQARMFSSLFLGSNPTVSVRGVAVRQVSAGNGCALSLATSGTGITVTGSSTLNMPNCVLLANSSGNSAIDLSGNSNTNVNTLYTVGNYMQSGNSTLTKANTPITNGSAVQDPYSSVNMPGYSGCNQNNYSAHTTVTLSPGVYCNGMALDSHANVTLQPGTYIINHGTLSINGQASMAGSGVTFVLTGNATVNINGGATVSLSAPTSGAYSGIAFYQDRNTTVGSSSFLNGGSTMDITGAVYMPESQLTFNGGNATNGSCTQIIGNTISFSGNNKLKSNCSTSGMQQITANLSGSVKLVE